MRVVRVLPDVAGLDKLFDYVVPDDGHADVRVGTRVRVELHGRRVGAWVIADGVDPPPGVRLRPLAKVSGWGPAPEVVELTAWAAWRWAGPRPLLLRAASPNRAVRALPDPVPAAPGAGRAWPGAPGTEALLAPRRTLVRIAPGADRMPLLRELAGAGPLLVVAPSIAEAAELGRRLRRDGHPVAVVPDGWGQARAGAVTVIGARAAAWAPAPDVVAMVVLDVHDEVHQEERSPTWHARDVLGERAAKAGVACIAVSPCPDAATVGWAEHTIEPARSAERDGWPIGEMVDLRAEDPANGLLTARLTAVLRTGHRVLCVLNRKGRARLLACHGCRELARCQACQAALIQVEDGLRCPRCGLAQPVVCALCGSQRMKVIRAGVGRVRDEMAALIGEAVGEVTATQVSDGDARVVVGTEAVLHRAGRAPVVAFLDFDQELLAPRYRAAEQALALLARAGRLTGGRDRGGRVLVQTRLPDHEVNLALVHGDPAPVAAAELARRHLLGLPPVVAAAALSGPGAQELVAGLEGAIGIEVAGPSDGTWLVRAPDHTLLCDALAQVPRPAARVRVEVDPLRL